MTNKGFNYNDYLNIPWDEEHQDVILKAVAQPREGNRWKANAYVKVSDNGLDLVCFSKTWSLRPYFGYRCSDCDMGQCDTHVPTTETIYWSEGTMYRIASYTREMSHKFTETIKDWKLNDEHAASIEKLGVLINQDGDVKKKNLYHLFTRLHTKRGLNKQRPADMLHQTWISQRWQEFKNRYNSLYTLLTELLKGATAGKEDLLLPRIDQLLEPYFEGYKK